MYFCRLMTHHLKLTSILYQYLYFLDFFFNIFCRWKSAQSFSRLIVSIFIFARIFFSVYFARWKSVGLPPPWLYRDSFTLTIRPRYIQSWIKHLQTFHLFSRTCLHHKWNKTRLLSSEGICNSCLTSCEQLNT